MSTPAESITTLKKKIKGGLIDVFGSGNLNVLCLYRIGPFNCAYSFDLALAEYESSGSHGEIPGEDRKDTRREPKIIVVKLTVTDSGSVSGKVDPKFGQMEALSNQESARKSPHSRT